jgi:hypothetical protein
VSQDTLSKFSGLGGQYGWLFTVSSNNVASMALSPDGTLTYNTVGVTDVCDDRWHHAVCTYDGAIARLYIDGVLEAFTAQFAGAIGGSNTALNIGGRGGDSSTATTNSTCGRVDEAFVTADVLSDDQVRNLYCAKIPHTLGAVPSRFSVNVKRRRRGAALVAADFPTQPLRLHNFSAGSLGDEGSNNVGLTNNGTAVSVSGADGSNGNAYLFSGAQSLFATDANLPIGLNARSFGCWVKSVQATGVPALISWGNGGSSASGAAVGLSSGSVYTQSAGSPLIQGPFIADGLWHFVVVVEDNTAIDGVKQKLYVDGKLIASGSVLSAIALGGAGRFRICQYADSSVTAGTMLNGQIDGVFVCDYALTPGQIIMLYAKSLLALTPSPKNPGDHIEAMDANILLATFDTLDTNAQVDLKVAS